ncbi:hypothetical protein GN244_ATG00167 [Phytophthora infestans]|uniref:Uncharacterized protein n=1 Tax=Phytophthora infestans TaxID=4787 RepID=A0A833TN95_PHYIN|nr:hypothetical protein GN244_ATG00167 [Phytophthora infestans]
METLLFAIEEHPDANREEVRNGRTRARRRNTKCKRRWAELHEDGLEIAGSVQGKSRNTGGLTATGCDTTSSLVHGKSEEVSENKNEELATGDPPKKPVGAGTTEKKEKATAVLIEPAASDDASKREQQPENAVAESPRKRVMSIPAAFERLVGPLSAGRTTSTKRRKRRAEHEVAAEQGLVVAELALKREARARVLRVRAQHLIEELRIPTGLEQPNRHRRDAQIAANVMKRTGATKKQRANKRRPWIRTFRLTRQMEVPR